MVNDKIDKEYQILMVDDEKICHETVSMLLHGTNYIISRSEYSGTSVMHNLEKYYQEIDIILVDIIMPDMSGQELVKYIRKDSRYNKIAIILQSGILEDYDMFDLVYSGDAIDVIVKPYDKYKLLNALKKASKLKNDEQNG